MPGTFLCCWLYFYDPAVPYSTRPCQIADWLQMVSWIFKGAGRVAYGNATASGNDTFTVAVSDLLPQYLSLLFFWACQSMRWRDGWACLSFCISADQPAAASTFGCGGKGWLSVIVWSVFSTRPAHPCWWYPWFLYTINLVIPLSAGRPSDNKYKHSKQISND